MDPSAEERPQRTFELKQHWLFICGLAGGLALRVVVMIAYRPVLLLQSDGYVYLQKAMDMEPAQLRPIFYSFFLRPFIELHSMMLVAATQHLLGIGMAVAIYVSLIQRGVRKGIGAAATLPVLFDGYQLNIEHYILSESLFQALVLVAVLLLATAPRSSTRVTALGGLLLAFSSLTRFVGVVGIGIALLYLLVYKRNWRSILAFAVAAGLPLLLYAAWFSAVHGVFTLTNRGGYFLYGRMAPFAECDWDVPKHQRVLCDERSPEDRPAHEHYVFSDDSPIHRVEVPPGSTLDEELSDFATGVIVHEPGRYLARVSADLVHVLQSKRYTGPQDARIGLWRFPLEVEDIGRRAFFVRRYDASPPPRVDATRFHIAQAPASFLRTYQSWIYLYGPLLLVLFVVAIAGWWRQRGSWGVGSDALFSAVMGVGLMLLPFFTINFDYRFVTPAVPLLPFAAALGYASLRGPRSSVEGDALAEGYEDRSL